MSEGKHRRVVCIHGVGPYINIPQIMGLIRRGRKDMPEQLTNVVMPPDDRRANCVMRLKSTDRYVLYRELPNEDSDHRGTEDSAGEPEAGS